MSKLARFVGCVWASPVTILGLIYVLIFSIFGWYKYAGAYGDALLWRLVIEKTPKWLNKLWLGWGGHTIGNVVVMRIDHESDRGKVTLRHEQEHVYQFMILGIFLPIIYGATYLGLKSCRNAHPYYDNPFEIDARRAAGQPVDVIGVLKLAIAQGKIQKKTNIS